MIKEPHALHSVKRITILIISLICLYSNALAKPMHDGLPDGFTTIPLVTGLNLPVDMEFMPDGGMLVAEKGTGSGIEGVAKIRLIRDGVLQEKPVLLISTNAYGDSGIQGIVLDPSFAINSFFYVWYATGKNAKEWTGESVFRLSRFTFDPSKESADPDSELIIIDGIPWAEFHNGGGLTFGQNRILYIATGDVNNHESPQDLGAWNGKILRIQITDTGYNIPGDNPFIGTPGAIPEVYAYGFRNPFRMVARNSNQQIYVADVGDNTWEELDLLEEGANYGWPIREGPCPRGSIKPCSAAPPEYTDPILYYQHPTDSGSAITGISFYEGTGFPEKYQDKLFFSDIDNQYITVADIDIPPVDATYFEHFLHNAGYFVDIEYKNDNLYVVEIYTGQIILITYEGPENKTPIVDLYTDLKLGAAPLTINYSAQVTGTNSTTLEYHWDFGDGNTMVTNSPQATHTYIVDGNYTTTLVVLDTSNGKTSKDLIEITVYSGEIPSIELVNHTEFGREQYYGGDQIEYRALRSTTSDLDSSVPFSWQINMFHNQHYHPIVVGNPLEKDVFEIPSDDHGGDWNIWYRFQLTMCTLTGIKVTVSQDLLPALIMLTITTEPYDPGITQINLNQVFRSVPYTYTSIIGTQYHAIADPKIFYSGGIYIFDHWYNTWNDQKGYDVDLTFQSPETESSIIASYTYLKDASQVWLPILIKP